MLVTIQMAQKNMMCLRILKLIISHQKKQGYLFLFLAFRATTQVTDSPYN